MHNILKRVRDDIEATQDSVWGMFSTYDSQRNFREALMNATMNATSNQEIIDSTDRAQEENNAVVIIMSIMAGFVGLCGLVFAFIQCFKSYYKQHDGALNDGPMTPSESYLRYGKPPVAYGAPTPDGPPRISSEFFSPHTPIEEGLLEQLQAHGRHQKPAMSSSDSPAAGGVELSRSREVVTMRAWTLLVLNHVPLVF